MSKFVEKMRWGRLAQNRSYESETPTWREIFFQINRKLLRTRLVLIILQLFAAWHVCFENQDKNGFNCKLREAFSVAVQHFVKVQLAKWHFVRRHFFSDGISSWQKLINSSLFRTLHLKKENLFVHVSYFTFTVFSFKPLIKVFELWITT